VFREGFVIDAVVAQFLTFLEREQWSLPAEAVQAPEYDKLGLLLLGLE
jgi:hypothetical protein